MTNPIPSILSSDSDTFKVYTEALREASRLGVQITNIADAGFGQNNGIVTPSLLVNHETLYGYWYNNTGTNESVAIAGEGENFKDLKDRYAGGDENMANHTCVGLTKDGKLVATVNIETYETGKGDYTHLLTYACAPREATGVSTDTNALNELLHSVAWAKCREIDQRNEVTSSRMVAECNSKFMVDKTTETGTVMDNEGVIKSGFSGGLKDEHAGLITSGDTSVKRVSGRFGESFILGVNYNPANLGGSEIIDTSVASSQELGRLLTNQEIPVNDGEPLFFVVTKDQGKSLTADDIRGVKAFYETLFISVACQNHGLGEDAVKDALKHSEGFKQTMSQLDALEKSLTPPAQALGGGGSGGQPLERQVDSRLVG